MNINFITNPKNMVRKYLYAFLTLIFLFSCEKVEKPYTKNNVWIDTGKKVLLEEFTAVRCVNCPEAHQVVELLKEKYGDQIVPVSFHVGFLATPYPGEQDFRTGIGDTLDEKFKASDGLPNGMINRTKSGNNYLLYHTSWASVIDSMLRSYPKAVIEIENQYDTISRILKTTIKTDFIQNIPGDIYLVSYIIEDSIKGSQDVGGTVNNNYIHRHVVRNHINGIYGEKIISGGAQIDQYKEKQYTFTLDTNWNQYKCHVVAYIYNRETYEVFQAEESKVVE